jgi:hypothetical protein
MFLASDTPIEIAPVAITVTAVVTVVFSHVNYADHRSIPHSEDPMAVQFQRENPPSKRH